MTQFSLAELFGITIRESANDGSDFTNPSADYRRVFLGEDGEMHAKDSAGAVTTLGGSASVTAHLADAGDAHDASAVSVLDSGTNFTGTDVEAVLAELQDNIDGVSAGSAAGFASRVIQYGASPSVVALSTAIAVAANGGSLAVEMYVPTTFNFEQVRVRNTDTTTARTWGWDLYVQNGATNTLDRVAASNGDESFTASGVSVRTLAAASAPVVIAPGIYWLVIQSTHATSSFGVGSTAASALATTAAQTKTTTNPNDATLDFTAATWTKSTANIAVVMDGRVFGQATPF